ncbi:MULTISPECIES: hypothetical protein [unclassified Agrococcus]|uniref:hypothetical protein n=1 Tax=unclassified Agrococcus TaxID=2615065 RepID=UPI00361E5C4B
MSDRYIRFERQSMTDAERAETVVVQRHADALRTYLEGHPEEIARAHIHNAGSTSVQALVASALEPRGFRSEVPMRGAGAYVGGATVDLVLELSDSRGIFVEVERGGTITNNHDLKDFWKTHIASNAHHLFLVVPMANWSRSGAVREKPFRRMPARFSAFFQGDKREVDVLSLHVFGYGSETALAEQDAASAQAESASTLAVENLA